MDMPPEAFEALAEAAASHSALNNLHPANTENPLTENPNQNSLYLQNEIEGSEMGSNMNDDLEDDEVIVLRADN